MSIVHPEKIGLGTWDRDSRGSALDDLGKLGLAWYYTWSDWALYDADPSPDPAEFVGMVWDEQLVSQAALDRILAAGAETLLGFNEPDLARQAGMSVEQALDLWGALQATGLRLVSPAASQEQTLGDSSWLGRFMAGVETRSMGVDVIAVHYYSDSGDIAAFETWLKAVHDQYGKPVWVTEWVLADWTGARSFSAAEQAAFARAGAEMMDALDFVERHAWFAAYEGGDGWYLNSGLFDAAGNLTEVGRVFADLAAPVAPPTVAGGDGDDRLGGGAAAELMLGGAGDDLLTGGGADTLCGDTGNDTLRGSAAGDLLKGGAGDDLYMVVSTASAVLEEPGAGRDRVHATVGWTLGADLEDLTLGGGALEGTGNGLGNRLSGNAADNRLDGLGGDDTLQGGEGNDWLLGGEGADRLWGGAGGDLMEGGTGDDLYAVDTSSDRILERPGEGWDRVCAGIDWTLEDNLEHLTLTGTVALEGTGNGLANVLSGNPGQNLLYGLDGDDTLLGGAGDDGLIGDAGEDRLWGGEGNDWLDGGEGDDVFDGGAGSDLMIGGAGADLFIFGGGWDRIADFEDDIDTLRLKDGLWAGAAPGPDAVPDLAYATAEGVFLDFGDGNGILIEGLGTVGALIDDLQIV
ncbi:glycosyl hydrolase [Rhodovulum sulfidophilum]|uniref:Asl1-like glycosyl hydrolase catalytic domain-containing protein n=3 Tax=Rhodovulum sulfidophilum TaxID=35806 RepID=A0ABS1RN82_RHOSU|nr:glycosyl hydrolase [Rhodovulum sulfidophilum]MBL3607500.1 hypothetical protein [Rhodovulum sulfidophilum]